MQKHWWRWLGLAGLVGVAVTGAAVARGERQRRAYTPDEIRDRLHEKYAAAQLRANRSSTDQRGR